MVASPANTDKYMIALFYLYNQLDYNYTFAVPAFPSIYFIETEPMIERSTMSLEDNTSVTSATSSSDDSDVPVPMTVNTFLVYAQYCTSCVTPDNTHHVLCSHFSAEEISEAKDVLWDKLQLSELKRTNFSKRSASEANVSDIM